MSKKKEEDTSLKLDKDGIKFVQQVTRTFLYHAHIVDPTMLVALSVIAASQPAPTEQTLEKTLFFLDYAAMHPDAILTYCASDMVLNIHSDASYLTEPKATVRTTIPRDEKNSTQSQKLKLSVAIFMAKSRYTNT